MSTIHNPNEWVDRYGDALYSYAFSRTNDSNAASDAVQETFLRALRKLPSFENRSSLKTWLTGILKNVLFEYSRQIDKQHKKLTSTENSPLSQSELQILSPDEAIQRSEFWEVVEHCLEKLPAKGARIFWESEVEHRPIKEIAQQLETSPNSISAQIYRARKFMRICMTSLWDKITSNK